ncbi:hypothetical protein SprV_0100424000 [Sparganum proliferum]
MDTEVSPRPVVCVCVPANCEDLARDRPTWRRTVKTGAAIYEANRIAAAKVKREVRKPQLRPPHNANAQPHPTCPRCRRTFRTRTGLVGHLRINCTTRTAPNVVPPSASSSSSPSRANSDRSSEPPFASSSSSSSSSSPSAAPMPAAVAPATLINTAHYPDTSSNINTTTVDIRGEDRITPALTAIAPSPYKSACSVTCESIAQRLTNRGLEHPPTPTAHLHCPRTFTHRMTLFGHMRIRESGIDRSPDTPTTPNTLATPSPTLTSSPCALTTITITTTSVINTDNTDFSCPYCPRTLT